MVTGNHLDALVVREEVLRAGDHAAKAQESTR